MKIILQQDVKNLGQTGDIVSVKKGYARHWLFPKKWAIPFTKARAAEAQHQKTLIEAKKKKALDLRKTLVGKLKEVSLFFKKQAEQSGKLFGSLTVFEIAKQLQQKGYEVDKTAVKLDQPLKNTGVHKVLLDFGSGITTYIEVHISADLPKKKNDTSS